MTNRLSIGFTHGDALVVLDDNGQIVDLNKIVNLLNNSYIVPHWCSMGVLDHFDGMGGCWGVSCGAVARYGEDYCKGCDEYKPAQEVEVQD